jgi:hypothetical protein
VILASGEVLHRGAVAFGGKRAQVYLESFESVLDAGLVAALHEHFVNLGMSDEAFDGLFSAGSGDQQIEVADGLAAAAETPGRARDARDREPRRCSRSSTAVRCPKLSRKRPALWR